MKQIILPKIVAVGIYNAQLVFKNRSVSPNRKTTMFELELPIEAGGVSYIDDSSHLISDKVVICAKPGQLRHTRLPFKCYYVHMIVSEGRLFDILSSLPNYIDLQNNREVLEMFVSLCEHNDLTNPENEIMLHSLLMKLIYTLDKCAPQYKSKHSPKRNNHDIIEETIEYISKNLASDLSLEKLCERANFTPIYFHKLFKASTGKTLREYVEEQRIKKAIELLVSTEMTLTQIAYDCGFSSQSYFSYAFKRCTGTTPRGYAKQVAEKYEEN